MGGREGLVLTMKIPTFSQGAFAILSCFFFVFFFTLPSEQLLMIDLEAKERTGERGIFKTIY